MNDQEMALMEKEIINGASVIAQEEDDIVDQYKQSMEKLNSFNIDSDDMRNGYDSGYGDSPNYISNSISNNNAFNSTHNDFLNDNIEDSQLKFMTNEQKRQNYVDEALHGIEGEVDKVLEFDIDKEKDEDDKNALLEQIDMLRDTLEDDGINLTSVPIVNKNNSLSDITNIYKILKLKNDRNRYCSFAEELILAGAYGLEYLFDGQKDYFGRRPDLIGWSSTVRIKLRRSRFQTSTLVKDMMQNYNMGPGLQLFLELIPSMFLYSRAKSASTNSNANDDAKYNAAISNLNDSFDERT
jgi:hypothetical protein